MKHPNDKDMIAACFTCGEAIEIRLVPPDGPRAHEVMEFDDEARRIYGVSNLPVDSAGVRRLVCSGCAAFVRRLERELPPHHVSFAALRTALQVEIDFLGQGKAHDAIHYQSVHRLYREVLKGEDYLPQVTLAAPGEQR